MPRSAVRASVDMGAFRSNFGVVRDLVGPNREILACVKADAYGHGLVACATAALDSGADALGVARLQEAAALRDDGISARIVTIAPEGIGSTEDLVALDVEIAVDSIERADAVARLHSAKAGAPESILRSIPVWGDSRRLPGTPGTSPNG